MPRLPSGREAAVSFESLLENTEAASFEFWFKFRTEVQSADDLTKFIDVLYFKDSPSAQTLPGMPPGIPVSSGLSVSDIKSGHSGWSIEDCDSFLAWFNSIFPPEKLAQLHFELKDTLKSFKGPPPDGWSGILDKD